MTDLITQITYDNNIDEITRAYALFRRKYALPRMLFMSLLFLVTLVFGINFITKNASGYAGYILTAVSVGLLISLWTRPLLIRKKIIAAVREMGEEKYTARFFPDRIEVDTEVIPKEAETEIVAISSFGIDTVENPEVVEQVEKNLTEAETSVYKIGIETLFAIEDNKGASGDIFCLFVNKSLFHIFPKRCFSEEQAETVREYFKNKIIFN